MIDHVDSHETGRYPRKFDLPNLRSSSHILNDILEVGFEKFGECALLTVLQETLSNQFIEKLEPEGTNSDDVVRERRGTIDSSEEGLSAAYHITMIMLTKCYMEKLSLV